MDNSSHWLDTIDCEGLIEAHGSPLYVYSEQKITSQVHFLTRLLEKLKVKVCYAVKANSNLAILEFVKSLGCGFDIVSEGEFRRVLAIGANPRDVVFAGVGKTRDELEFAVRNRVGMINVESHSELDLLSEICRQTNLPARISLRINPDIDVDTHPYLSTGLYETKFGIPIAEAPDLWHAISSSSLLQLVGVDCHIGSHVSNPAPLLTAYAQVIELGKHFAKLGAPIECVDFGGGFAVNYKPGEPILDMNEWGASLVELLSDTDFQLIIEPGKFITAEAGILLSRVIHTKSNTERDFVIVDAGMNDLIRPPLYQAHHEILLLREGKRVEALAKQVTIAGPVCETGCFFAKDREFPQAKQGDLIAVLNAGAYCFSMASNYNSRRLPAEVFIRKDGAIQLIGRRQTYEELWAREFPFYTDRNYFDSNSTGSR